MRTILRCWPTKWRTSLAGRLTMLVLLSLFGSGAYAQSISFSQAANANPTLGNLDWINSILNANNSQIYEGMSTLQRIVVTGMTPSSSEQCLVIKLQADKAGFHAYDFITSWQQALDATDVIDGNLGVYPDQTSDSEMNTCQGLAVGGQPPSITDVCNSLHETGHHLEVS